jgi:adenylate cyclase class IV
MYKITAKGERNGEVTESSIPFSVRQLAENAATVVRISQNRASMIKTEHNINKDGTCKVVLELSDGLGEIVRIELNTVDEEQANKLKNGFSKNAEKAYNTLIKTILET